MDFNKLKEEYQKEDAVRVLTYHGEYGEPCWPNYFYGVLYDKLENLEPAERLEYIKIVANAKGVLTPKELKKVMLDIEQSCQENYWDGPDGRVDGFLTKEECDLFKGVLEQSQAKQFRKDGRNNIAERLKQHHRNGMSVENRKRYLLDNIERYPLRKRGSGDSLIHRALDGKAKKEAENLIKESRDRTPWKILKDLFTGR